ncbi:glycosyl hydrolase family 8 [Roseomonas sp. GC11]|uniref:glycosyl hydrolase family 8 n=1 Tax=Roseomonas sp. GC11 TaxID=2950546 RepID=UPI00210AF6E2|nr:glycosyl hydrolase family 8 [Roseomonas sp. GC11]MCQ4162540.1 glycosyl hydrolase family 8 [Roseomonas sp. GC11]
MPADLVTPPPASRPWPAAPERSGGRDGMAGEAASPEQWTAFKRRYLAPDGRVIDTGHGGLSHSEGQSYGLLFAVHFDDPESFALIWDWTRRLLQRPRDGLFSWKYEPRSALPVPDANNATDGDLVMAWALLRAARRWGGARHAEEAAQIARAVLAHCTTEFLGRRILLPGARGFHKGDRIVANPSYFSFAALRALSRLVPDAAWAGLEAGGLDILRACRFGRWNLPPDWCEIRQDGTVLPAPGWPPRFSWDALRIPLHLGWAGLREEPLLAAARFFQDPGHPVHPPAWADLAQDTISPYPGHAGVQAVAQLAARGLPGAAPPTRRFRVAEAPDYYGASLILLCAIAAMEPPEPPPEIPALPAAPPRQTPVARLVTGLRALFRLGRGPAGREGPETLPAAPPENPLGRRGSGPGGR